MNLIDIKVSEKKPDIKVFKLHYYIYKVQKYAKVTYGINWKGQ